MLTLLGGTIGVLFPRMQLLASTPLWIAGVALGTSAISLCYGIYALVRSYVGYVYEGLPLAGPLLKHRDDLIEYHRATSGRREDGEREFEELIDARRIAAATRNAQHNIRRGAYLHQANMAIVIAALLLAVAAIPTVLYVPKDDTPIRVQIVPAPEAVHDRRQQPIARDERVPTDTSRHARRDTTR